jgi:aminoglycoside phosphotransferase family enzyme/predicted kinase
MDDEGTAAPIEPAAVVETHISVIVFVGDRAYKLKKPVDLGFLDFSTVAARREACHRETDLNRRLAPDVYLGVADVIGPEGETVDHLVVMRRMPSDRRLTTLVVEGDPAVPDHLRALARLLADFHSGAERSPTIDLAARPDAVLANWQQSFDQMRPFVGSVLDADVTQRIEDLVGRYVTGREELFEARIAAGKVCDGHGDLQADDIYCLDDRPRVLDCLEFDDRYRHGDVLADVAFLAMDLDRLGAAELGSTFLRWYREFSADVAPRSLVEHYVAYRAHVRCKVNCLRADQATGAAREDAAREARRLLQMTRRYLERARVRLVLVGGLPGTGKSTLARHLGTELGWTVLRSDETRKERAGLAATERSGDGFGEGLYTTSASDEVYDDLLARARTALRAGETVVLDASWASARHRQLARQVARECVADLDELRCEAPVDVSEERLVDRLARGDDASDATPDVARRLAQRFDAWPEASAVETSGSEADSIGVAVGLLSVPATADDVAE